LRIESSIIKTGTDLIFFSLKNSRSSSIVLNSMSGSTKEESNKNYEKIIKNVIKESIIDK
jgi:hypothetical protein